MASLTVLYWRDIPAQVIAREGRAMAKRELPARFQEAIDMAAMKDGARDEDSYLAGWRKADPTLCGPDLESESERAQREIEAAYDHRRLQALAMNGGREDGG
jgi:hypothetical protein